jgi:hypothetical protein
MFFSSFVSIGMGKMLIVSTVIGTWKVSCKLVLCNPTSASVLSLIRTNANVVSTVIRKWKSRVS